MVLSLIIFACIYWLEIILQIDGKAIYIIYYI